MRKLLLRNTLTRNQGAVTSTEWAFKTNETLQTSMNVPRNNDETYNN